MAISLTGCHSAADYEATAGRGVLQRPSEPVEPLQRVHVPRLNAAPTAMGPGRDTAARDPLVAIPGYVPREVP